MGDAGRLEQMGTGAGVASGFRSTGGGGKLERMDLLGNGRGVVVQRSGEAVGPW